MINFLESEEFKNFLAGRAENPAKVVEALKYGLYLRSGSRDQQGLNMAICDYLKKMLFLAQNLVQRFNGFDENGFDEKFGQAVLLYGESRRAMKYLNCQKTKYLPPEVREARKIFDEILETLDRGTRGKFVEKLPPESQPIFWQRRAFRRGQRLEAKCETPWGTVTVYIERAPRDPRWFLSLWVPMAPEGKKEIKSNRYIISRKMTTKDCRLEVSPVYNGREFVGITAEFVTYYGENFRWHITIEADGSASIGEVEEI
jgi:hypothetical protein